MKRIICFILICIITFTMVNVRAEGFKAVVDKGAAERGEEVETAITFSGNSGLIAAIFELTYDTERLELTEVVDTGLLEGGTFGESYSKQPYVMVWNSATDKNFTEDGALAVLKFKVKEDAEEGRAFIALSYDADNVFDVDLNNVGIEIENGYIDVEKGYVEVSDNYEEDEDDDISDKIVFTIGKKEAVVFGEIKQNDVAPIIRNDRTMLPARFVAENLGARVSWNNEKRCVEIKKDNTEIIITIDSQIALVNGTRVVLDSEAFIENDRTYTPVRFVAEKLGAEVSWDNDTREVIIKK